MTALNLIEQLTQNWQNVIIHKQSYDAKFAICINHKGTIKTNQGVNGITLYSKKRFLDLVGNFDFTIIN